MVTIICHAREPAALCEREARRRRANRSALAAGSGAVIRYPRIECVIACHHAGLARHA
jgi:hypothetical protein